MQLFFVLEAHNYRHGPSTRLWPAVQTLLAPPGHEDAQNMCTTLRMRNWAAGSGRM